MNTWFECKVTYEKATDSGSLKRTSESYLIDAATYTDAEARLVEEVTPFTSAGEFTINSIKRVKLAELFLSNQDQDDKYFRCKVQLISLDEKSGTEKRVGVAMIVQSNSLRNAVERLTKEMDATLYNYELASVTETPLVDVLQHAL